MDNNPKVSVIGMGELGQAVGKMLLLKNITVDFWDKDASKVPGQKSLEEVVRLAEYVLFCVPSWALREALAGTLGFLSPTAKIVVFAKGLESGSNKTSAEILSELAAGRKFGLFGGPMIAEDVAAGRNSVGVAASPDDLARKAIAGLFASPSFRVEISSDMFSVSLASVLKNIYALSLGVADGIGLGGNEKGWMASIAAREMLAVADELRADRNIILGTAGLADFLATAYSPYSLNREIGEEIAKKGTCNLRGEGPGSTVLLLERVQKISANLPLLLLIKSVVVDCAPAEAAFRDFFGKN